MKDLRQTSFYALYMKKIGWEVVSVYGGYCYLKKIPLLGTHIKVQRPDKIIKAEKLISLAKKRKAYVVYVEPLTKSQTKYYLSNGYKKTKETSLPSKTIRINLQKSEKKILSEMHHKTRYNIGLAKRRGIKVRKSGDIDKFADFWQECAHKRKMYLSQKREIKSIYESFGRNAKILFAYVDKKLVAAVMVLSTKTASYYMYASSTEEGNKNFAPSLLAWEAIALSKKAKKKIFDFEGIYDKRHPIKTWKGFSRFKKGFGGDEFEYEGSVRRYFLPL